MAQPARALYAALIFILLVISFTGCGYQFVGTNALPAGIQSIHVDMFDNRTRETGYEAVVTEEMVAELMRLNPDMLLPRKSADGLLSGKIRSLEIRSSSHTNTYQATEREAVVVMDVRLEDRSGDVVWAVNSLVKTRAYAVSSDKYQTEANKKAALDYISKRLAEQVVENLTAAF